MCNSSNRGYAGNPTLFIALFGGAAFLLRSVFHMLFRQSAAGGGETDDPEHLKPVGWQEDRGVSRRGKAGTVENGPGTSAERLPIDDPPAGVRRRSIPRGNRNTFQGVCIFE
jgi:hypothetical protein